MGVHKDLFKEYEHSKETEQSSVSHEFATNDINENKLKCEEDINIEDLNLKLDEGIATDIIENSDENESDQNTDSLKDLNIPCNSNNSSQEDSNNASPYENVIDSTVAIKELHLNTDEVIVDQSIDINAQQKIAEDLDLSLSKEKDTQSKIDINEPVGRECSSQNSNDYPVNVQQSLKQVDIQRNENVVEDDFGDFDDFKFDNTRSNVTIVVDSSNPWENNETNEIDFGNFRANFEENKFHSQDSPSLDTRPMTDNDQLENQVKGDSIEDDDFGDFDDFQSSTVKTEPNEVKEEDECQELSVLNLQATDSEHHIMESITKVLTAVFVEEITEPDIEFEGKLDSLLSETWGHLMETDERQPYIVNWNNSLGQKTLLRALCIDSRNIVSYVQ